MRFLDTIARVRFRQTSAKNREHQFRHAVVDDVSRQDRSGAARRHGPLRSLRTPRSVVGRAERAIELGGDDDVALAPAIASYHARLLWPIGERGGSTPMTRTPPRQIDTSIVQTFIISVANNLLLAGPRGLHPWSALTRPLKLLNIRRPA